jgi:hypothetical protein
MVVGAFAYMTSNSARKTRSQKASKMLDASKRYAYKIIQDLGKQAGYAKLNRNAGRDYFIARCFDNPHETAASNTDA